MTPFDGLGSYRSIRRGLLRSEKFMALPAAAQWVFAACVIEFGPTGVEQYTLKALAHNLPVNMSHGRILKALQILTEAGFVRHGNGLVWIRGQLQDSPHLRSSDAKHRASIQKHVAELPRCDLVIDYVREHSVWFPISDELVAKRFSWVFGGETLGQGALETLGEPLGETLRSSEQAVANSESAVGNSEQRKRSSERANSETPARAPSVSDQTEETMSALLATILDPAQRVRTRADLLATLTPVGASFEGRRIRAVDERHLVEQCEAVRQNPPNKSTATGWLVLTKLGESYSLIESERAREKERAAAREAAAVAKREAERQERERERREAEERAERARLESEAEAEKERRIDEWCAAHPDEFREIQAEAMRLVLEPWPGGKPEMPAAQRLAANRAREMTLAAMNGAIHQ